MFKVITIVLSLFFVTSAALADGCEVNGKDVLNDPVVFSKAIEKSETCYEAAALAESCAWGSSLDVQTVSLAYDVCSKELDSYNPDKNILSLLDVMKDTCNQKYMNLEGSMYRSMMSYCHLSALQWILNIAYYE